MFPSRRLISGVTPFVRSNLNAIQQRSVTSGPPAVRMSFAEKLAHMSVFAVSMFAIPVYVLCNVKRYRDKS